MVVSLLIVAGLLIVPMIGRAGILEPSAPPAPTMKTLDEVEPRKVVQSLPGDVNSLHVINEPGSYYLTGDVNVIATDKNGIAVEVDDVTIDLMGYNLIGPDSGFKSGIYIDGCTNVEVRNGTIRDFGGQGIYEADINGCCHRVINVRLVSNGQYGIILRGEGHLVKDCFVAFNENGGIVVGDEIDKGCSTVTGNILKSNGGNGIQAGEGSTVTGNTVKACYNRGHGIYVQGLCIVTGNTLYQNGGDGIRAKSGCTISVNTCDDNGQFDGAGIHTTGTDNRIEKNNLTNTDRGLEIDSTGSMISDNIVKGNTDNYDIAAGNQLNILLCEVPETIDWPAMVKLAGTLTTNQTAVTVTADNVTIDLAGHSLVGDQGAANTYGIYMSSRSNIEIRNGTVLNFGKHGIYENSSGKQHRLINVRAMSNTEYGIYLNGYGHLVKDCTAAENTSCGIRTDEGCTVTGNTVYRNDSIGILTADFGCTVTGNTAYDNGTTGISAKAGSTVTGNTAMNNGADGIYAGGSGCTVTGNTCYGNGDDGIETYSGCTITGNVALGSTDHGIYTGAYCLVDQNTAVANGTNIYTGAGCVLGMNCTSP